MVISSLGSSVFSVRRVGNIGPRAARKSATQLPIAFVSFILMLALATFVAVGIVMILVILVFVIPKLRGQQIAVTRIQL
ncbi:MAG: hypothetical protein WBM58_05450, partial [Sedimenticolaceae bacterium]